MTAPTREELREAVEDAIACLTEDENGVPLKRDSAAARTLQTWLDSGLTDSERETVAEVVRELRSKNWTVGYETRAGKWLAALAPIAEGKP